MSDSTHSKEKGVSARRRFLADMARAAGGVALLGLGVGLYSRQAASLPAQAIRPPGAGSEADFLSACVRCGLCVRECPVNKKGAAAALEFEQEAT